MMGRIRAGRGLGLGMDEERQVRGGGAFAEAQLVPGAPNRGVGRVKYRSESVAPCLSQSRTELI